MESKIKFKTDIQTWQSDTLNNICISCKTKTLKQEQLIESGLYPVVNGGISDYGRYNNYNCENALTISARGEAGHIRYVHGKFWAGGLCYAFISNRCDIAFISYSLMNKETEFKNLYRTQTSIPAVNKSDIKSYTLSYPTIDNQRNISLCFTRIDRIIKNEKKLIGTLYKLKKASLVKLFSQGDNNVPQLRFRNFTNTWEQCRFEKQ